MQCPSCGRVQEPRLLCVECQAPVAPDLDYFATLDLPRRLLINSRTLEEHYHEFGRRVHPDRFANAPVKVRAVSLRATALLTRAYRTLQDPIARGNYWLELNGQKLAQNNQQVPPELAAKVFEVQEAIEELQHASTEESAGARSNLLARREEVRAQLQGALSELHRIFGVIDESAGPREQQFECLKLALAKIAYLKTLMRDVDKALDIRAAA
jgi:molecular chaperone HscB